MALKLKLSKAEFEKLAPAFQAEYTVNPDNPEEYSLGVEGLEDTQGIKTALDRERRRANEAEKAAKKFEGLDVDAAKKALEAQQQAETERLQAQGKFDELKGQLIAQHQRETKALEEKLGKKDAAVGKLLIENVARKALADAKVKGTGKAVLPQILAFTKVVYDETSGEYQTAVLDAKGNTRIGNGKGDPMTIEELVAELKADPEFAVNFEPSGTTGGGSQQSQRTPAAGGQKVVNRLDAAAMSANFEAIARGEVRVE